MATSITIPSSTNANQSLNTTDSPTFAAETVTGAISAADFATGTWHSKALTLANALTTAGNFALTLTQTGATNVTLPTTGTLATTAQLPSGATGSANATNTITVVNGIITVIA